MRRKTKLGVVVSNKMDKTAVVQVERKYQHPFYHKVIRATAKFKAHDEKNECAVGDLVEISETRPLSRDKCWRVSRLIGKAQVRKQAPPKKSDKELANLARQQEQLSDTTAD